MALEAPLEKPVSRLVRPLLAIPVPCVFMLGYIAGAGLEWLLLRRYAGSNSHVIHVAGTALFYAGALLAAWGWMIFHFKGTTKIPGEDSTVLVTIGPYRVTRNPMYVGCTLAYIGAAGSRGEILPLAILPFVLAYVNGAVIPIEERRLRAVFGPAYDSYRERVRRWL
jgi:protein-S-isoprenylcysteine O-methyltransferase Ste14